MTKMLKIMSLLVDMYMLHTVLINTRHFLYKIFLCAQSMSIVFLHTTTVWEIQRNARSCSQRLDLTNHLTERQLQQRQSWWKMIKRRILHITDHRERVIESRLDHNTAIWSDSNHWPSTIPLSSWAPKILNAKEERFDELSCKLSRSPCQYFEVKCAAIIFMIGLVLKVVMQIDFYIFQLINLLNLWFIMYKIFIIGMSILFLQTILL